MLQVQCSSSNAIKKGCTPDFRFIASRPSFGLSSDFAYRLETLTLQRPYSLSAQLQPVLIFGISFMTQSNAFCITLPISKRMPCISNREGTLFSPFSSKKKWRVMGYKENSFAFSIAGFSLVCSSHLILMIDEMPRLLLVDDVKKRRMLRNHTWCPFQTQTLLRHFLHFTELIS